MSYSKDKFNQEASLPDTVALRAFSNMLELAFEDYVVFGCKNFKVNFDLVQYPFLSNIKPVSMFAFLGNYSLLGYFCLKADEYLINHTGYRLAAGVGYEVCDSTMVKIVSHGGDTDYESLTLPTSSKHQLLMFFIARKLIEEAFKITKSKAESGADTYQIEFIDSNFIKRVNKKTVGSRIPLLVGNGHLAAEWTRIAHSVNLETGLDKILTAQNIEQYPDITSSHIV